MNFRVRSFIGVAITILVFSSGGEADAAEPPKAVLDARTHHLGFEDEREWQDLDGQIPEGRSLQVDFQARANAQPATLFIRQRDVKLRWPVLLNGRKLGLLDLMEYPQVATLSIPPGLLRDGTNSLSILSPESPDDIFIDEIVLDTRPPEEARREGTIHVRVTDGADAQPVPCRLTVADSRGMLAPLVMNPPAATTAVRPGVVYTATGSAEIGLPAGEYTLYATRGFEYGVAEKKITVRAGGSEEIALAIAREVATPGMVACDTHIHTFTCSKHGDATSDERVVTLAGEGVEFAVASDHNQHADYSEAVRRLGMQDRLTYVHANEVTTTKGHFIAFPVSDISSAPADAKLTDWPALIQSIRQVPGTEVIILNHPRDVHNGFIPFAPDNFDAASGRNLRSADPFSFDAIEVCNSGTLQSDFMQSFRDWFALLNHGYKITAVGSSDSHDVSRFIVGQGRTYIVTDDRSPGKLDVSAACRQLKAGRASVSMGLLVDLTVNGKFVPGDVATGLGDETTVTARVFGPRWVRAERVRLFANGIQIREEAIATPEAAGEKVRITWRMPKMAHDVHLVAIADGPPVSAPYWAIPYPYQPTNRRRDRRVLGATNPIWMDVDGDDKFTAARGYAERVVRSAKGDAEKLNELLKGYDAAVGVQAACLQR